MLLSLTVRGFDLAVAGGERDLDLVHLVPLLFRTVAFGNRLQLLQTCAGIGVGRGFVHDAYYLIVGGSVPGVDMNQSGSHSL
jgi:hypothetical protein